MQRTRTAVFVCAFAGVLILAGAPSITHLPGAHPPWAVALLVAAGAVHALAVSAGLLFACTAPRSVALRAVAAALGGLTCTYIAADALIYGLVGVHLGRATWGHLLQPGSLTTLGIGAADAAIALLAFAVTFALCVAAAGRVSSRLLIRFAAAAVLLDLASLAALAVARFQGIQPLVGLADAMPLAPIARFDGQLMRVFRHPPLAVEDDLLFPPQGTSARVLEQLRESPRPRSAQRRPDILFIVLEGLRADALPRLPALSALSAHALTAERHYSSGNCSFLGNFGLLSGLPASYWGVRDTARAPLGLGAFAALGYRIELKSSAALNFSLDVAVLPAGAGEVVPTEPSDPPVVRDEENTRWAEAWARAERKGPSLAVLFLDQSHWPYNAPGLSPASGDAWALRSRTSELHERYIAALQAEDRLVARVLSALRGANRYDSTIIVATGDHGEAFREHGVLSHGSRLDEEQVLVPLILSVPGRGHGVVPGPSVHHDVLPTLLGLIGASGVPPCAVCGIDLLQAGARRASPLTLGSCGISFPTGFAALLPERKILFQLDDRDARLVGALAAGDAAATASGDDPEVRDVLAKVSRASRELLQARTP